MTTECCRSSGWANGRPIQPHVLDARYETAECFDCWFRGPLVEVPEVFGLPGTRQVLVPHAPVRTKP